jgi:hypothetical protein
LKTALHIVSFNVPDPPDYGGAIDVFYRIEALSKSNVDIILHCFQYGREESEWLATICKEVYYYPRKVSFSGQLSLIPFIVHTRMNPKLLDNLCKDNFPILFEGLHCCGFIDHPRLAGRLKLVRAHNKEHEYYKKLAKQTNDLFKKIYFSIESARLSWFEQKLRFADRIFAISGEEQSYFAQRFKSSTLVLPFHPNQKVNIQTGFGSYILYHGNLEVEENLESAKFILEEIAPLVNSSFIFSGKNPGNQLYKIAAKLHNVKIVPNPSAEEMLELIRNAHINLLITFQDTGFKLKLMHALYNGRFCVVNKQMVRGTSLEQLCLVKNTVNELVHAIEETLDTGFTEGMIEHRKTILENSFSNMENARIIEKTIRDYSHCD